MLDNRARFLLTGGNSATLHWLEQKWTEQRLVVYCKWTGDFDQGGTDKHIKEPL